MIDEPFNGLSASRTQAMVRARLIDRYLSEKTFSHVHHVPSAL